MAVSTCISSHGEYSDHTFPDSPDAERFVCTRRFVFDEDAAMEALDRAEAKLAASEARLAAVRALHWPQPYADADLRAVSPSLPKEVCAHCRSTGDGAIPWPCPTIRALCADPTTDGGQL